MGGKNTPSEGPKKGHFWGSGGRGPSIWDLGPSIWGLGGPFSTILDHDLGTTLRGPPLTPNSPLAMDFGGPRAPQKGRFWVIFGSFLAIFEEPPGRGPPFERLEYGCFGPEALKTAKNWPFFVVFGAFSTQRRKGGGFGGGLLRKTSDFETP